MHFLARALGIKHRGEGDTRRALTSTGPCRPATTGRPPISPLWSTAEITAAEHLADSVTTETQVEGLLATAVRA